MKQIIFLASVISMLLIGNMANAQSRQGSYNKGKGKAYMHGKHKMNIGQRQQMQNHRIRQGIKNGSITKAEARHLRKQQFQVRNFRRMAKADGRITRQERMMINKHQRNANRDIAYMKHNKRTRNYR